MRTTIDNETHAEALKNIGRMSEMSEAQDQIQALRNWLTEHPYQKGTQSYSDRLNALGRWLSVARYLRTIDV